MEYTNISSNTSNIFKDMAVFDSTDDSVTTETVFNMIFMCLSCIILCVMMYIGYRVYKIVKWNDIMILSMIIVLNLVLVSEIFFYVCNEYYDEKDKGETDLTTPPI